MDDAVHLEDEKKAEREGQRQHRDRDKGPCEVGNEELLPMAGLQTGVHGEHQTNKAQNGHDGSDDSHERDSVGHSPLPVKEMSIEKRQRD